MLVRQWSDDVVLFAHTYELTSVELARLDARGVRIARGNASVDTTGQTSAIGVWAAGNVVDPRAEVITAAGAGSAAIAINADLVQDDVERALI
jgi:thioredoxin reductase